jgi:hypothetical protein
LRYILFHPTRDNKLGGAQALVVNVAEELARQGKNVVIIDHRGGYASKNINDDRIKIIIIKKIINECYSQIKETDILICFNRYIRKLMTEGDLIKCKVLFWDVYYPFWKTLFSFGSLEAPYFTPKYKRKLLNYLVSNKALLAMERRGSEYISRYSDAEPNILPIPTKNIESVSNGIYNKNHFCYVGRFQTWKVYPFIKIIEDFSKIERKVVIDVFTDSGDQFKLFVESEIQVSSNVSINYIEGQYGTNLYSQLNCYQLVFAMGTACLEASQCKVPAILMDLSNVRINNYSYRFLYENNDFGTLGRDYEDIKYKFENFENIIERSEKFRNFIINRNEIYIEKIHSISSIVQSLVERAGHTKITTCNYVGLAKSIPFFFAFVKFRNYISKYSNF